MNMLLRVLGAVSALTLAGTALGQVPSSNDTTSTDGLYNTGMGTGALSGAAAGMLQGEYNTASGYKALNNNTTGSFNTALGFEALIANTTGNVNTAAGWSALSQNATGVANTAFGSQALSISTGGSYNSAFGQLALVNNTADYNTALGSGSLYYNTTGQDNTATGYEALYSNTGGSSNTATGYEALYANGGDANTASGAYALHSNASGGYNSAFGTNALDFNTTGSDNTATGADALFDNTQGSYNAAFGTSALQFNTTGADDTAAGVYALDSNTSGGNNTGVGYGALSGNSTGSGNTALGYNAGKLITDSNNIDIGSVGAATDKGIIRLGTKGTHEGVLVAGIYTTSQLANSLPVYVNENGRLSAGTSSERFKTEIAPMGASTSKLGQLRPVTFHLKSAPQGATQYGLIAEEVAKVYPELVIRDASGRIDGVRYDELAPMLLNEMKLQNQRLQGAVDQNRRLAAQVRDLQAAVLALQKSRGIN